MGTGQQNDHHLQELSNVWSRSSTSSSLRADSIRRRLASRSRDASALLILKPREMYLGHSQ